MMTLKRLVLIASMALTAASSPQPVQSAGRPLLAILQSELQRNIDGLKNETAPPYFVSYTVHDARASRIAASFGALQRSDNVRTRFASIEVRVGDYGFDNTHPVKGDVNASLPRISRIPLPLTDDEPPIRLALWHATDRSYKLAAEAWTRVKTNVAAKVKEEDPAPDFSREEPQIYTGTPVAYTLDTRTWEARLRRLSAPFAEDPLVFRGEVSLQVEADNRYYTSSEGSQVATGDLTCRLSIQAATKADDGMELPLYASYFARTLEGLPDEKQLANDARDMIALLGRLRKAPLVDPFSGPAILSGRAAGVFFHEIFGHRVEGQRQKNVDDAQTFGKRIDQNVLPPFLNVVFDPMARKLGAIDLSGSYQYDDEGVKARRVTVVDQGILKTFLLGRAPLSRFPQSNGHGRAQPGFLPVSRQSNLLVESSKTVTSSTLTDMLKAEARKQGKPFGLLFENIEGGFTLTGRTTPNAFNVIPNVVYRIYTDGRAPELVRGVDLIGTPLAAFGKIIATGDKVDVFNGICGAESGGVPVSAASPPLLVSEVEVQKKSQSQETLPLLPAPQPRKKSLTQGAAGAQDSPIVSAMQDEVKRSMAELRLKDQPPPYYIAYDVDDTSTTRVAGRLGALVEDDTSHGRTLRVDVRVGDYTFDSSRFVTLDRATGTATAIAPLDDDYDALRREIWLITDAAYKRAVNVFAKKKAAFQNRAGGDAIPDFSRETPRETVLPPLSPWRPSRDAIDRVQQISAAFASSPALQSSEAGIMESRGTRYYVNSENFKVVAPVQSASMRVIADTQAEDGAVLRDFFLDVENTMQEMPPVGELVARARALAARLTAARATQPGEEYIGPVMIEGQASAELVAQRLVPLLLARRPADTENARAAQPAPNPFLSRIGSRVLPEPFSVSDTPSLKQFNGRPVPGAYAVDDEAVAAQDVTLIENGKLLTLLTSRTPQKNLLQSNGHGRGGNPQAGVFQLRSTQAVAAADLKKKYLDLLKTQNKPFGYIVRAIANPSALQVAPTDASDLLALMQGGGAPTGGVILDVVKVTPDGTETPVRGLHFATIALTAWKNVLDASTERQLYSYRNAGVTVSVIVPSLIFEELEIQKVKDIAQKPPIVPSPLKH
jgi:predicted Zn-dependent protease